MAKPQGITLYVGAVKTPRLEGMREVITRTQKDSCRRTTLKRIVTFGRLKEPALGDPTGRSWE